jgi:flagellar basal body-associated protein FliL
MKKQIVITAIIGILVGVVLTAVGYSVYIVVSMQTQVRNNSIAIEQIVNFLNKAITPATTGNTSSATPATE